MVGAGGRPWRLRSNLEATNRERGGSQSKGEEGIVVFMTLSILFLLSVQGYMRGYCLHTCYLRKEENKKPDIFLKKREFSVLFSGGLFFRRLTFLKRHSRGDSIIAHFCAFRLMNPPPPPFSLRESSGHDRHTCMRRPQRKGTKNILPNACSPPLFPHMYRFNN